VLADRHSVETCKILDDKCKLQSSLSEVSALPFLHIPSHFNSQTQAMFLHWTKKQTCTSKTAGKVNTCIRQSVMAWKIVITATFAFGTINFTSRIKWHIFMNCNQFCRKLYRCYELLHKSETVSKSGSQIRTQYSNEKKAYGFHSRQFPNSISQTWWSKWTSPGGTAVYQWGNTRTVSMKQLWQYSYEFTITAKQHIICHFQNLEMR
jgi:hypothetical protein